VEGFPKDRIAQKEKFKKGALRAAPQEGDKGEKNFRREN